MLKIRWSGDRLIFKMRIPIPGKHSLYIDDDIIKWKHFPCNWPFVWGFHQSPVASPHKGQWRKALMFSLICTQIYDSVSNREASDLRRHRAHYDVTVIEMGRRMWECGCKIAFPWQRWLDCLIQLVLKSDSLTEQMPTTTARRHAVIVVRQILLHA